VSERHPGLLGALAEVLEIQETAGIGWDEARELQRQQEQERLREYEPSNVIYGVNFRRGSA
jgi:hypothetical protein